MKKNSTTSIVQNINTRMFHATRHDGEKYGHEDYRIVGKIDSVGEKIRISEFTKKECKNVLVGTNTFEVYTDWTARKIL